MKEKRKGYINVSISFFLNNSTYHEKGKTDSSSQRGKTTPSLFWSFGKGGEKRGKRELTG